MKLYIIDILARILGIIIPLLIGVAFFVLVERKVMASMQHRQGPNVVGLFGLLQPLAYGFKLMIKKPNLPSSANLFIITMAPIIYVKFDCLGCYTMCRVRYLHRYGACPNVWSLICVNGVNHPEVALMQCM